MTHTIEDDSLTHLIQWPVPCPFFSNHHAQTLQYSAVT